jgi:hypothetical protein
MFYEAEGGDAVAPPRGCDYLSPAESTYERVIQKHQDDSDSEECSDPNSHILNVTKPGL